MAGRSPWSGYDLTVLPQLNTEHPPVNDEATSKQKSYFKLDAQKRKFLKYTKHFLYYRRGCHEHNVALM